MENPENTGDGEAKDLTPEEAERRREIAREVNHMARQVVMLLMSSGLHPLAITDICAVAASLAGTASNVTREQFMKLANTAYDTSLERVKRAKEMMPAEMQRVIDGTATNEDLEKVRARMREAAQTAGAIAEAEATPRDPNEPTN